jgi:hypothetical protein
MFGTLTGAPETLKRIKSRIAKEWTTIQWLRDHWVVRFQQNRRELDECVKPFSGTLSWFFGH